MGHQITDHPPINRPKYRTLLVHAVTAFTALLFVYTATDKLLGYDLFVGQMQLVPVTLLKTTAPLLGWAVPLAELAAVAALFTTRYRRAGLVISLALMSSFALYIVVMLLSGIYLPCTCGGLVSAMSWPQHLIFNGVVIALLTLALRWYPRNHELTTPG